MSQPLVVSWAIYGPNQPLQIPILSAVGYLDLTTLTTPTLSAIRPDTSVLATPWAATVVPFPGQQSVTPTAACLQYAFAQYDLSGNPSNDTWRGPWRITPYGVIGSAPVKLPTVTIRVVNEWDQ